MRNRLACVTLAVLCLCFLPAVAAFACDGCEHSCGQTVFRAQSIRSTDHAAEPAPHTGDLGIRAVTQLTGTTRIISPHCSTLLSTPLRA
jgi:hypothetical protein